MNEDQEIYENYIEDTIKAVNAGNFLTAYNILHKAEQINPNGEEVIELLHYIESHLNSNDDSELPNIRLRKTNNYSNDDNKEDSSNRKDNIDKNEEINENHYKQNDNDYTQEQYEVVKKIEKCQNYYEVLGVERNATDLEIRKAYKKLALQLHPDKNHAPGSIEAFKAIGNAVAILTDTQKRHEYDLFGSKNHKNGIYENHHNHNQRYRSRRQQNNNYETAYEYGFESNISAEELFNIFFGADFSSTSFSSSRTRRNRNLYHRNRDDELSEHAVIAFAIIIILIIMSILSSLFSSDPFYNLSQNSYIFHF